MKILFEIFILNFFVCLSLYSAEWKKINSNTIEVSGNFNKNEIQNLRKVWTDDIKSIILKESSDNDLDLSVGRFLKTKKFDVTINGLCSINCVENLLLPATNIKIEHGCIRVSEKASDVLKFGLKFLTSLDKTILTKNDQSQYVKSINEWMSYQDELFKLKNLKPTFYADHDLVAKGLIYFPSATSLKLSGLRFQGDVDLTCIIESKTKAYYYF